MRPILMRRGHGERFGASFFSCELCHLCCAKCAMTCSTKRNMGILPNDYSIKEVVVGTGFEPVKAKPADLQSALVDRLSIPPFLKEPIEGLEPTTC